MNLFDLEPIEKNNEWQNHWNDMPEFVQEKKTPFSTITIRFESELDLIEFSKIINQKLTPKTKSIWFPFKSHFRTIKKQWQDE